MKEQPIIGGSYIRQSDGTLKRAEEPETPKTPPPAPRRAAAAAKQPEK